MTSRELISSLIASATKNGKLKWRTSWRGERSVQAGDLRIRLVGSYRWKFELTYKGQDVWLGMADEAPAFDTYKYLIGELNDEELKTAVVAALQAL